MSGEDSKRPTAQVLDYATAAKRMVSRGIGQKQKLSTQKLKQTGGYKDSRVMGQIRANSRMATITSHFAETVTEPARTLPVLARCDVLVVGGGPSGLSAALGAARAGADVLLMEKYGCFGGVITTVGMETLGWYRYEGTVDCEVTLSFDFPSQHRRGLSLKLHTSRHGIYEHVCLCMLQGIGREMERAAERMGGTAQA